MAATGWPEKKNVKKIVKKKRIIVKKNVKRPSLTDPFFPGKLKKTSGPFLCGICRKTFNSFVECFGCEHTHTGVRKNHQLLQRLKARTIEYTHIEEPGGGFAKLAALRYCNNLRIEFSKGGWNRTTEIITHRLSKFVPHSNVAASDTHDVYGKRIIYDYSNVFFFFSDGRLK